MAQDAWNERYKNKHTYIVENPDLELFDLAEFESHSESGSLFMMEKDSGQALLNYNDKLSKLLL